MALPCTHRGAARRCSPASLIDPMTFLVHRTEAIVEWGHCDPIGMAFPSRVFEYLDAGSWALFRAALGVEPPMLASTFGIMGIPLVDARLRALAPLRFGDHIEVFSNVSAFRRSSFDVEHQLMVRGALAVEGRETRVWAGADTADRSKLHALPIPDEVKAKFTTG